jgi:hypothetical protein
MNRYRMNSEGNKRLSVEILEMLDVFIRENKFYVHT